MMWVFVKRNYEIIRVCYTNLTNVAKEVLGLSHNHRKTLKCLTAGVFGFLSILLVWYTRKSFALHNTKLAIMKICYFNYNIVLGTFFIFLWFWYLDEGYKLTKLRIFELKTVYKKIITFDCFWTLAFYK